jgi:hypothetical protein
VYDGEWFGDAMTGKGRYSYVSGAVYEGGFAGGA